MGHACCKSIIILLLQVEGQTHRRGANLYEFADLLVAHGVINAVNLDGGGSSTLIHDQILINYPSDHWYAFRFNVCFVA